jgi:hypothetical protein
MPPIAIIRLSKKAGGVLTILKNIQLNFRILLLEKLNFENLDFSILFLDGYGPH